MDTGRKDGLFGEIEAELLPRGRAVRFGGVSVVVVVVGLGRGWRWGVLPEATSCPSASFQAHPKAEGVSCWVGDLCSPRVVLSEAPPFSCPPSQGGGAGGSVGVGSLGGTPGWPCPAPLGDWGGWGGLRGQGSLPSAQEGCRSCIYIIYIW